ELEVMPGGAATLAERERAGDAGERAGARDGVVLDLDRAVGRAVAVQVEAPRVELVPRDAEGVLDVVVRVAASAARVVGIAVAVAVADEALGAQPEIQLRRAG